MSDKILEGNYYVSRVKLMMIKEPDPLYCKGSASSPEKVTEMVYPLLEHVDREIALVISVDAKSYPMAVEIVAVGGVSQCMIDIKNIFKHAILNNATGIIVVHNHPSGKTDPSNFDLIITKKMRKAAEILDFEFLDHIVIGENKKYFSFKENDWSIN